jgi:hypothetical protein
MSTRHFNRVVNKRPYLTVSISDFLSAMRESCGAEFLAILLPFSDIWTGRKDFARVVKKNDNKNLRAQDQ